MNTYQGTCKHCGWIQPVMARSQEEADRLVALECVCGGAEREDRLEQLKVALDDVAGEGCELRGLKPLCEDTVILLQTAGVMVLDDLIQKISIETDGTTIRISVNAKGTVKVDRRESRTVRAEC